MRLRLRRGRRRSGWKAIPGSITNTAEGNGIDGSTKGSCRPSFDLSAYAGKTVGLRVRYATDGAARATRRQLADGHLRRRDHRSRRRDRRCSPTARRTATTAGPSTASRPWGPRPTTFYDNYYIAGHRSYVSYDKYLKSGPYNFGFRRPSPTGRALPVPGGPADLLLGHLPAGQQRQPAPR